MQYQMSDYRRAADTIRRKLGDNWDAAVILGTGLGALEETVRETGSLPYSEIPGFCVSTAPSHRGVLVAGEVNGRRVLILSGRLHAYENYTPEQIVFPIRVLRVLGVENLVITNGSGGLNTTWDEGDYMAITDHLSFGMVSPCNGPNLEELGPRFFDISTVYDKGLLALARTVAQREKVTLREGVYAYMPGPQFESPAEVRALKMWGGDCVGMSTVHEAVAAAHCGMRVLGISHIANFAVSLSDGPVECGVVHNDKTPLVRLVAHILSELPQRKA